MYRVNPPGRSRHVRTLLILVALLGLAAASLPLTSGFHDALSITPPSGGAPLSTHSGLAAPRSSPAASHATAPSASLPTSLPAPSTVHPAASGQGLFWSSNANQFVPPIGGEPCSHVYYTGPTYNETESFCSAQSVSPSLVNLANGDIGVGYSTSTNVSGTHCLGAASQVSERVEFTVSSNNGSSFGPKVDIGNDTCAYLDAIEPSFLVAPDGTIFGVFVEYNQTGNQGDYTIRSGDALAFTHSTNSGSTFSTPVTLLSGGNIAKPQIVDFGRTLYVLYQNISNGTASVPFGLYGTTNPPISENLLVSVNAGATWSAPIDLPGENATANDADLGGSIAVNSAGLVGVSMLTNVSCIANSPGFAYTCWSAGGDIVYLTSSNNGSTWSPFSTVQTGVGESEYYPDGFYLNAMFQVIPQTQLIFSPDGQTAYIVWAGTFNKTALNHAPWTAPYYDYDSGGIFFASGPSAGTGWTVVPIALPMPQSDENDNWNPSIGLWNGTIWLAYTTSNITFCEQSSPSCSPISGNYNEWMVTSSNGLNFSVPSLVGISNTCQYGECETYWADESFAGYNSAVGFTTNGTPLVVYAMPETDTYNFAYAYNSTFFIMEWFNYSDPTALEIATPYRGPTVSVNFTEVGLVPGTEWSVSLSGVTYTTTDAYFNVTNVPYGLQEFITSPPSVPVSYGTVLNAITSISGLTNFYSDTSVNVTFVDAYLFNVDSQPVDAASFIYWFDSHGVESYFERYIDCFPTCIVGSASYYPDGQYYDRGTTVNLISEDGISYWSGTGNGSYTGSGTDANVTFFAPINETGWVGAWGSYNVSFVASGIPASSTVHFDFNGVAYSGSAAGPINVSNVNTGAYQVTDIWATSTSAGYEYFGQPTLGNPIVVPAEVSVPLTFSEVDLASPAGQISFEAAGLSWGTVWTFAFNGTTFSSSTPWINVSSHPGTYPVHGFPVVAQNDTVGYTPTGVGPTWTVATGVTYTVTFVSAEKVTVIVGTGGTVTGGVGSFWLAQGSSAQYIASAKSGYGFAGWTGTGLGSYTGTSIYANLTVSGPIIQSASFYPLPGSRFNLTFSEGGLAPGTWWTVFVGGSGYSSNLTTFEVHNLLACGATGGTYNLTIPYAYSSNDLTRFIPTSHLTPTICTSGTTTVNEVFAPEYLLTLQSTTGGFAEATIGANNVINDVWVAAGTSVDLLAVAQSGYDFLGWNGSGPGNYTGAAIVQGIVMSGPLTELATFQLHVIPAPETYTLTFRASGATFVAGTVWGISLGGTGYSSTSSSLTVSGLTAASYTLSVPVAYSPDGQSRYTSIGAPTTETVTHNATVTLSFTASYWVSIESTPGGTVTPGNGWVNSGSSIALNATPLTGYEFNGWTGTGSSAYTGPSASESVVVSGPISESASFAPAAHVVSTSPGSSSLWTSPTTWIGLGLVGLVIGLLVGIIVSRRGGRQPPAPYEGPDHAPEPGDATAPDGGTP
jgi:Divergent InlB B-repeat domain